VGSREKAPQVHALLSSTHTFFSSQSTAAGPFEAFLLTERLHIFLVLSAFGGSWCWRSKGEAICHFTVLLFLQTTSAIAPAISPRSKKASDITDGYQMFSSSSGVAPALSPEKMNSGPAMTAPLGQKISLGSAISHCQARTLGNVHKCMG
jgi:hypothetical protein